jgi:hypothetical protein
MPFQQIFLQLGLRGQIGGVGGRSHPGFRHFHTTKTQSGRSTSFEMQNCTPWRMAEDIVQNSGQAIGIHASAARALIFAITRGPTDLDSHADELPRPSARGWRKPLRRLSMSG